MKILRVLLGVIMLFGIAFAKNKYENNVFSIDTFEVTPRTVQSVVMFLPASDRFAPNVNVQIQPYQGTMKEYDQLSMKQFKAMNLHVVQHKLTQDTLEIEYKGTMGQGNTQLHWYALAFSKDKKVYLITATSLEKQWNLYSKKLIECVKSFKFK